MAPQIARRNRVHGAAPYSVDDRDVYDFLDNVSYYLMNRLNQAIIAVDKATRDMGEEGVKGKHACALGRSIDPSVKVVTH